MANGNNRGSRKKKIDNIDAKIIRMLQKNGSLSNTDIARALDISEATVRGRLKRLIEEEYIQIVAVSNPYKLGFGLTGDIYIKADPGKVDIIIKEIKKIRELWFVVTTTGSANINAEFIVRSRKELNDLIHSKIGAIDGILSIETSLILEYHKRKYDYGTALDADQ